MAINIDLKLDDQATRVYNQFVGNVKRQAISMDGLFKGVGAAVGAAFSIQAIAGFMKAAADSEANVARLDAALKAQGISSEQNKASMLEYSDELKKKLAVDDDVITNIQATIVALTGNAQATRQLTPLVLDLARGLNMDAESAAQLVAKTLEGDDAMSRYGIKIGETSTKQERLTKITEELTKKFAGQAEAFAQTDAGRLQSVQIQMDDLEKTLGKVLNQGLLPLAPALQVLEPIAKLVGGAIYMVYSILNQFSAGLVGVVSIIERLNNVLGISSSTFFADLAVKLEHNSQQFAALAFGAKESSNAIAATGVKINDTIPTHKLLSDQIKDLKKKIDELNVGSKERIALLVQLDGLERQQKQALNDEGLEVLRLTKHWDAAAKSMEIAGLKMSKSSKDFKKTIQEDKATSVESSDAIKTSFDDVAQWYQERANTISQITSAIGDDIGQMWYDAFTNKEDVLGNFLKASLNQIINFVEGVILAASAKSLADQVLSFGALAHEIGIVAASFAGLELARAAVNRFHDGGVMGFGGERIPLRNDERPAILKVGETVIPTKPGESISSGGTTIIINNHAPVFNAEQFVKDNISNLVRKTGLTVDKIFVNNRSKLAIS